MRVEFWTEMHSCIPVPCLTGQTRSDGQNDQSGGEKRTAVVALRPHLSPPHLCPRPGIQRGKEGEEAASTETTSKGRRGKTSLS